MLGAREYDETGIGETGRFTDSRTAVTSATSCKIWLDEWGRSECVCVIYLSICI